jgi:HlyD family secretion protein
MKKNLMSFVRNNKWWVIGGAVVVLGAFFVLKPSSPLEGLETASAEVATITQEVRATGKVAPVERAALAFEKTGTVSKVYVSEGTLVKKGDLLIALDSGTLSAELNASRAKLATEQARLAEVLRGTRQEELQVSQVKVSNADRALNDARDAFFTEVREAYVTTYDAIVNTTDSLFNNGVSSNPTLAVRARNVDLRKSIEQERVVISETLEAWNDSLNGVTEETNPEEYSRNVRLYTTTIKDFLSQLQQVTQELTPANSALSDAQITEYRTSVITALEQVTTALQAVITAEKSLNLATADTSVTYRELDLDIAGSAVEEVVAQRARVAEAEAVALGSEISLSKSRIVSPIDGIVTQVNPEVGESVSVGTSAVTVMSNGAFKVEVQIPEVDIAKVKVGDLGRVTLDAYGAEASFDVTVSKIDPAETIVGGIPTYKVTLVFANGSEKIRSGMTANIILTTGSRADVVTIPFQALEQKDGKTQVRIVENGKLVYRPVTTGLRGTNGMIEIVEGIATGEIVVVYEK